MTCFGAAMLFESGRLIEASPGHAKSMEIWKNEPMGDFRPHSPEDYEFHIFYDFSLKSAFTQNPFFIQTTCENTDLVMK